MGIVTTFCNFKSNVLCFSSVTLFWRVSRYKGCKMDNVHWVTSLWVMIKLSGSNVRLYSGLMWTLFNCVLCVWLVGWLNSSCESICRVSLYLFHLIHFITLFSPFFHLYCHSLSEWTIENMLKWNDDKRFLNAYVEDNTWYEWMGLSIM